MTPQSQAGWINGAMHRGTLGYAHPRQSVCTPLKPKMHTPTSKGVHRYKVSNAGKLHCINDMTATDPACGTSGFLVSASEYLKETKKQEVLFNKQNKNHYMNHMFHGFDMDRTMLRIGAMNMMTHGVDNPYIEYRDSLSDQNPDKDKYSLILANPPV